MTSSSRTESGRRVLALATALLVARSAFAFLDPLTLGLGAWLTSSVALPVAYGLGCAFAYSPGIRVVGTERAVYGLDWGSLACHAENVYGLQLGFCGGSVEDDLYGLQIGLVASGYAQEELPFDGWHFYDIDRCRMNGIQFGTFAAKTATANGFQLSAVYNEARTVNGVQVGLVNTTTRLHGLQAGLYNSAGRGLGLQVGLINCAGSGLAGCLPVLNLVY